ncbi:hypothetical protein M9H77_04611 [Catharanthus roseus]|uniref:Uncharacterized protein n=1 Tax=Catharanthus roseus TaxID=4058 RepID=A0ACC0CF51_CATRO|nr:hypothetical protein M9H77_04611 [Catharanthus roseus]
MKKYLEKWKKGSNAVEETSSNKGNVNNEDPGKNHRVVEISNCDIVGDPALRKSIGENISYWRSSFDRGPSVISRFSTTFALISSALIKPQLFCPGSATPLGLRRKKDLIYINGRSYYLVSK